MKLEELKKWLEYSRLPKSNDIWDTLMVPYFEHVERLTLFQNYLMTMEGFLEQEIQKHQQALDDEFERLAESFNPDDTGQLPYFSWLLETTNEFANTLRKSFFVNLYGFWEAQLLLLCLTLENYDKKDVPNISKFHDFDLTKAKFFLRKIHFPLKSIIWNDINNYKRLRNCIVHHDGHLDGMDDEEELKKFICARKSLLSLVGEDVFLEGLDGIFLQEGIPILEKRLFPLWKEQIAFQKGDIILDHKKNIHIFNENVLIRRGDKFNSEKVNRLPEKRKIIFRNGVTDIVPLDEPVSFRRGQAVVFQEGEKVIFRTGEKVVFDKGFCEKALGTVNKYFDELLAALENYGKTIKAA